MKIGTRIKANKQCLMDGIGPACLTEGKFYTITGESHHEIVIIDDGGDPHTFYKETISDFFDIEAKESLLLQAEKIVNGDRNDQYGDAKQAFKEYSGILKTTFNIELTPEEICKVMMSIKLGRLKHKFKEDSLLDLIGYSEILNRLQ